MRNGSQLVDRKHNILGEGGTATCPLLPDMFGEVTQTIGSLASDFQYAGYYFHAPTGLNLTTYRAYNPTLGRWINRDPSALKGGINLYAYCGNSPVGYNDSAGLAPMSSLGNALSGLCSKKCHVKDIKKCKSEAASIAAAVQSLWNNAAPGSAPPPDACNGYYCYSWAQSITKAAISGGSGSGGSFSYGYGAFSPSGNTIGFVHVASTIGTSKEPCCKVYVDDGFGFQNADGTNTPFFGPGEGGQVHAGTSEPPPGWNPLPINTDPSGGLNTLQNNFQDLMYIPTK